MRYAYVLNSAVITAPGTHRYDLISPVAAQLWLAAGPYESMIGYAETCIAFEALLGVPVALNRRVITMLPGDEALVFRLILPPGSPRITPERKGALTPQFVREHCEIGLRRRTE